MSTADHRRAGVASLLAVLGVGLGALVRDQALAIAAALVTLLAVEPLVDSGIGGLLGPFSAGQSLQASQLGGEAAAGQLTGAFVLAGYTIGLIALGVAAFNSRGGVPGKS